MPPDLSDRVLREFSSLQSEEDRMAAYFPISQGFYQPSEIIFHHTLVSYTFSVRLSAGLQGRDIWKPT
jgi:hypothetical protein